MLSPYTLSPTDVGGMGSTSSGLSPSLSPSNTPQVSGGGYTSPTMLAPAGFSIPSAPTDVSGGGSIPNSTTLSTYGTSGTPVQSGDGSGTTVGGSGGDYFQQAMDLIAAQLKQGSASDRQQFAATTVLPASAKYGGASDGGSASSGASPVKLLLVLGVGAGLYYWFRIRKRGA